MHVRRYLFLLLAATVVAACGSDTPTGPQVGEMMTVAEQVAIPSALDKVAKALDATGQAPDSNLAGFTRIAAQLLGRGGVQGTVVVSNSRLQKADTMHAVAGLITQSGVGALQLHYVLAWSGLDVNEFTIQRALVLLVDGSGDTTGTFGLSGPSAAATGRYLELNAPAPFANTDGTLDVADGMFAGDCAGTPNQGGITCETGSERVGVSFTGTTGAGERVVLTWDSTQLPAYHLASTAASLSRVAE